MALIARWLLVAMTSATLGADPDLILHGGQIVTVDDAFSIRQAIAIRDGLVQQTGDNDEILKLPDRTPKVVDLVALVLPG